MLFRSTLPKCHDIVIFAVLALQLVALVDMWCCKLLFFSNIRCFGGIIAAGLDIFNALSSCLQLQNLNQIATASSKLWRHVDFLRWRPESQFHFRFRLWWLPVETYLRAKFLRHFSIHGWDILVKILLLLFFVNKLPPCCHSTFGFDFHVCVIIGMSFCVCLLNFMKIGPSATVTTSYLFSRWRPRHRNSTAGFVFFVNSLIEESRSLLPEISQSMADIFLLPVSENKRQPCWNTTSGFNFHVCVTIGVSFCICLPNFVHHPWQSYDVITIFQDSGHDIAILLPLSFLWVHILVEMYPQTKFQPDIIIHGWDITTSFLKTNVGHVWSGFVIREFANLGRSKCTRTDPQTKFRPDFWIRVWDITTSGF